MQSHDEIWKIHHSYSIHNVPISWRMKNCIMLCSHMLLKVDLYLDQWKFAKRQLMKFVCDSEGFLTPNVHSLLPSWPACQVLFRWDSAFSGFITGCCFTSSRKLAHPVEIQRGQIEDPFSFLASSFLQSWPACQVWFCSDRAFSGCITRCIFTSSRKLAHPLETPRGPYEDPYLLQHLVFFYLDPPAKFCFSGTVHSVAALQDAFLHPLKNWHTL
jgi:hypothetical protein